MKQQQLSTLKDGARFVYGGVEWVKLEHLHTAPGKIETVAIAAEPVFERAFDEENCNDWRKSSLRQSLQFSSSKARPEEESRELPVAFVPHWKTCPNAGDFRRSGRG